MGNQGGRENDREKGGQENYCVRLRLGLPRVSRTAVYRGQLDRLDRDCQTLAVTPVPLAVTVHRQLAAVLFCKFCVGHWPARARSLAVSRGLQGVHALRHERLYIETGSSGLLTLTGLPVTMAQPTPTAVSQWHRDCQCHWHWHCLPLRAAVRAQRGPLAKVCSVLPPVSLLHRLRCMRLSTASQILEPLSRHHLTGGASHQ